jgi:hypothetical protein
VQGSIHSALLTNEALTDIGANIRLFHEVFEPCFERCLAEHDIERVRDGTISDLQIISQ